MIIGVDVDDTLANFGELAREIVADLARKTEDDNIRRAAYLPWNEWRTPADLLGNDIWFDVISKCHSNEMILKQIPFNGCQQVLWDLIACGHQLLYISNRSPEARAATYRWLQEQQFPSSESYDPDGNLIGGRVKLICTHDSKKAHLAPCQFLIDDRPKTLVEFVYDFNWKLKWGSGNRTKQRLGFGLHRPYNEDLTDIPGIYLATSWNLLAGFMEDKGLFDVKALAEIG